MCAPKRPKLRFTIFVAYFRALRKIQLVFPACFFLHTTQTLIDLRVDPINIMTDTHIDAGTILKAAMLSPRNDAVECLAICERLRESCD